MQRFIVLLFGITAYFLGVSALVYLIGFLLNLPLPKTIDSSTSHNLPLAVLIDVLLIALFGLQHSLMARPAFKRAFEARFHPSLVRGAYMVATAIVVYTLCLGWQPMPETLWKVENPLLRNSLIGTSLFGWSLVLYASFLIDHFDLFGLRQAWLHFLDREYSPPVFQARSLYRHIRHPIMTGVLIGIWITPEMSVGHLLFSIGMTGYILIGVHHEEKDLRKHFGDDYEAYARGTGRFLPAFGRGSGEQSRA